jgi:hypothetical protein
MVLLSGMAALAAVRGLPASGLVAPGSQERFAVDSHVAADSARILEDLFFLASDALEGRALGSRGGELARARVEDGFREAGLGPPPGAETVQPFLAPNRSGGAPLRGANVLALVEGSAGEGPLIVITAHYDHVGVRDGQIFNGADDNASGTAALLSIARYLARSPLRHDVLLAALDGEERGLRGAEALLGAEWLDVDRIALNVNMDMVARSDSVLYAAGAYHTPALRPILDATAREAPVTLLLGHDEPGIPGVDDWTRQSDHGAFHARGIPFVYFGVEDHPDYHRPTDDAERIDPGFYMDSIRTILMAVRALDDRLDELSGTDSR